MTIVGAMSRLGTAFLAMALASAAKAQDLPGDCLASFNVKADRNIVYFGWLPDGAEAGTTLSCPAAEELREQLFRGQGLTAADLANAVQVPNPLKAQRDLLAKRLADLKTVTTVDQAKVVGQTLDTEVLKYNAAYGCLVTPSLKNCGRFVVRLAGQAFLLWKITNNGAIEPARAAAAAEVERQIADLDKIISTTPPAKRTLEQAKQILLNAQLGLCQEVKKSCL